MSADIGVAVDSSAPNLNLSPEEKRAYGQLFRQADTDQVGVVTGEVAVKFFEKTRLDSRILGEIWQIADKENRGFLTPAGFGIVLRLIGHAQAGREPTAELALQKAPLPRFDGFTLSPNSPASPALQAQVTGGGIRIPPLTPDKVAQYAALFERQQLQANVLPGEQARQIFDKSGLTNDVLGRIWELSDTEQRGALVQTEFVIAMHLLTSMKTGTLRALPNVLPAALYEAATMRGAMAAPRQSPNNTGLSAIPRQMSGSTQPRTSSPLGQAPMAPQTTGLANDWAVSPADKARFDQIYNDLDKAGKGFITGEEAVPFLSKSELPEDTLAQIWDFADFSSQGHLTREGFAVAMYLIRQLRSSRTTTLPTVLPPNLIPPSVRSQQARAQAANSGFAPPPVAPQPPPPAPKSALDDLFGLESGTPSPAPAPAQPLTHMSTGGSNAHDPFAGGPGVLTPSSPVRPSPTGNTFKPFVPSSSFGRGLTTHTTGDQGGASEDLLADNDPEASKKITGETAELANLSSQIGSLSKQTQDVQAKRTATQNELNQTNSQKQNFEQRLAQLRTLYEKEAQDTHALEEQLRNARNDTKKLQSDCMSLEGQYKDIRNQHQQVLAALQADQQENAKLRESIRAVNAEIAQLKPQIEKLKSEARQQKGLVAINKKQLSTTEGERDKHKSEVEELAKSNAELFRQANTSSPVSSDQVASPAGSTASGNNPFFKRTASTDILGAFASPPARTFSDKSFDDVFGPSFSTGSAPTSPPMPPFSQPGNETPGAGAGAFSTPPAASPILSRHATLATEPTGTSGFHFSEPSHSVSTSRQASPSASRNRAAVSSDTPDTLTPSANPPAFPADEHHASEAKATPGAGDSSSPADGAQKHAEDQAKTAAPHPFGESGVDDAKAKADFENAFAAFTTGKSQAKSPRENAPSASVFSSEFPPISELERDDDSDSNSDGGFDDNFAPATQAPRADANNASGKGTENLPEVPAKDPIVSSQPSDRTEQSPFAPTSSGPEPQGSAIDDIFGSASSVKPATSSALDDLDDDFEGLEDAKEGSADDDFANISRSGLDDFNPVFDSSPPASQAKTESTAFGNESSFDFISSNSAATGSAAPTISQQKTAESHDWDAIFSGLDTPTAKAPEAPAAQGLAPGSDAAADTRPNMPGRALTTDGEHDDPILKQLTGMGYSRTDALAALEKYDYSLERAANYLASQS
ncbi:hypothetical protein B0I35DRAFT_450653 [Stachybotrys elegans]|uniref:UBA domain-containing protein n=1 Tax=Stachybotrys elegans TaxID=80388 RepID=A0A8K0SY26_9HYPO|nr:hypothetical protein B0I35DRAFT_450653 [Stachybotrys elegans]